MRGVSARSRDDVLSVAEELAGANPGLGDELLAIVSTLDSAPALRRVLTDPTTTEESKSQLAGSVFGQKVSEAATSVLDAAVRARWTTVRSITDALEAAGISAYANAADDIDAVEDELFSIGEVVRANARLRAALSDRTVDAEPKSSLLNRVFGSHVSAAALAMAAQAVRARTGSFEKVLTMFAETAAERNGLQLADVRVAHQPTESERTRLAETLSQRFGTRLHLNIIVDPAVIGGMSVSVGSQVFDGTMSSRLESARRLLAG